MYIDAPFIYCLAWKKKHLMNAFHFGKIIVGGIGEFYLVFLGQVIIPLWI